MLNASLPHYHKRFDLRCPPPAASRRRGASCAGRAARAAQKHYDPIVEETTNQAHRDLVDEATYLRGRIISAYAQVEFLLADFISKLEDRFAYRIE